MGSDERKQPYTLFQGHAGPVYAASFSPRGDYILSSSSDATSIFLPIVFPFILYNLLHDSRYYLSSRALMTVRLWSNKLNANLVCYKGHNYPVWDVQVR